MGDNQLHTFLKLLFWNTYKNVSLKVQGTRNVVLEVNEIPLEDRSGSVSFAYELTEGASYESIILTVTGEHDGKIVNQSSQIYLRGV